MIAPSRVDTTRAVHMSRLRADLLAHRREVSALDPSLPQRTGRAFSRWWRIREGLPGYREYAASRPQMKKNAEKQIVVFGEVHPELDAARIARVIIEAAAERSASAETAMRVAHPNTDTYEGGANRRGVEAELGTDSCQ